MLEQIILPIMVCLLATATCALCVFLFATLKRELFQIDRRRFRDTEELRAGLEVLRDRVQDVTLELESGGPHHHPAALPMPSAVNINKRTQALRMVKRGEGPERIAAILNLSPREVDLLVKVEKLIAGASAGRATA